MMSFVVPIRGFKMFAYYDIEPDLITGCISDVVRLGAVEIHLDSLEQYVSLLSSTTIHTLRLDSHEYSLGFGQKYVYQASHPLDVNHFNDLDFLRANLFHNLPTFHELDLNGTVLNPHRNGSIEVATGAYYANQSQGRGVKAKGASTFLLKHFRNPSSNMRSGAKDDVAPLPISVFLVAGVLKDRSTKLLTETEARGLDDVIKIVLPQLERLELRLVSHGDPVAEMVDDDMGECRVILDAPRLMYMSLYSDFEVFFEVVDSPIVVTAQLHLGACARGCRFLSTRRIVILKRRRDMPGVFSTY
ncbi:hypothetical protein RHMOL_Rhmol06G0292100 [Rhododendron molle]|uniref:Uncharacterized protein n=1 Tax=Rhododendron molle TaxID=49168 RepID=A0ACC0NHC9_RHOML|nr:hypothetical protein RHMOL_Rhmol06G0292100 [Rhododendron molle]